MGRDKVLGLSLAILLIGFAGAFCFRNEPFVENGLRLARAKLLDEAIARRPGPKPYASDPKLEPDSRNAPAVTLQGIESIEPFATLRTPSSADSPTPNRRNELQSQTIATNSLAERSAERPVRKAPRHDQLASDEQAIEPVPVSPNPEAFSSSSGTGDAGASGFGNSDEAATSSPDRSAIAANRRSMVVRLSPPEVVPEQTTLAPRYRDRVARPTADESQPEASAENAVLDRRAASDHPSREPASKEPAPNEPASQEIASQDTASREAASPETSSKEIASQETTSHETSPSDAALETATRDKNPDPKAIAERLAGDGSSSKESSGAESSAVKPSAETTSAGESSGGESSGGESTGGESTGGESTGRQFSGGGASGGGASGVESSAEKTTAQEFSHLESSRRSPSRDSIRWEPSAAKIPTERSSADQMSPYCTAGDACDSSPTRLHRVKRGDTLTKLARHYLGNGNRYLEIFEANRDQLRTPADLIKIGMSLRIPRGGADSLSEETPASARKSVLDRSGTARGRKTIRRRAAIHNIARIRETPAKMHANNAASPAEDAGSTSQSDERSAVKPRDWFVPVRTSPLFKRGTLPSTSMNRGRTLSQIPPDDVPDEQPRTKEGEPTINSETSSYRYFPRRSVEPQQAENEALVAAPTWKPTGLHRSLRSIFREDEAAGDQPTATLEGNTPNTIVR